MTARKPLKVSLGFLYNLRRNGLAEEADAFITSSKDPLKDALKTRYDFDFSPALWQTTAYRFLMTVRRLALSRI